MKSKHLMGACACAAAVFGTPLAVSAAEQEAIDGCIEQLRTVGGPDGQSGEVLSSEFSEAATLVMLKDAGGTVWRCLAYSDGTVGELTMAQAADDGGGAMAGAGGSTEERVQFAAGTSGAELTGILAAGESRRYLVGARNEQFLYFRLAAYGTGLSYQIFNPDGTFLLDQVDAAQEYRGQLWQSGDHVIEVINRSGGEQSYNAIFGIE